MAPNRHSTIASLDASGNAHLLELGTSEGGGYVTAYGPNSVPTLRLGHYQPLGLSGLIAMKSSNQPEPSDAPSAESLWGPTIQWPTENGEEPLSSTTPDRDAEASPDDSPSP